MIYLNLIMLALIALTSIGTIVKSALLDDREEELDKREVALDERANRLAEWERELDARSNRVFWDEEVGL